MKKILLGLLICGSLQAATITLGDGENNESTSRDGRQSSRTWDLGGGLTMTVTAFVLNGSTTTAADITQFGNNSFSEIANVATLGLGVCSPGEGSGSNCGFNEWQVDNFLDGNGRDFLMFSFNFPVNIGGVLIRQTSRSGDSDAAFATGDGLTLQQLVALLVTDNGPNWPNGGYPTTQLGNGYSRLVGINANGVTQLIFGTPGTDRDDLFKVYSIDVSPAVPEPGSMLLLSAGLAGIGLIARRRRTQA